MTSHHPPSLPLASHVVDGRPRNNNRGTGCATSARSWRPIMPRGEPRGHGIFCRVDRRIRKGRVARLANVSRARFALVDRPVATPPPSRLPSTTTPPSPPSPPLSTVYRPQRCRCRRLHRRLPRRSWRLRRPSFRRDVRRRVRHSKETTRLGILGAQPVARAVFGRAPRYRYTFCCSSLWPPPPPRQSPRQRYNRCIDVSNLSARDAAAIAAAATPAAANLYRRVAARSNSWHNSPARLSR